MKVISILNQKGGVGKTTITYNLSTLLAKKGYKTLMIDSDSQCSLTLMTGNDPTQMEDTIVNIYDRDDIKKSIYKLNLENLFLIPSSLRMSSEETKVFTYRYGRESLLKNALDKVKNEYDFVVIDNSPSLGIFTINNLNASDYVVAPVEPTNLSVYALDDLENTIMEVKENMNPSLCYLGIIVNKFDKRIKIHNDILSDLVNESTILGIIKNSIEAVKGIENGQPSVINNPNSDVAKSFNDITDLILRTITKGVIYGTSTNDN